MGSLEALPRLLQDLLPSHDLRTEDVAHPPDVGRQGVGPPFLSGEPQDLGGTLQGPVPVAVVQRADHLGERARPVGAMSPTSTQAVGSSRIRWVDPRIPWARYTRTSARAVHRIRLRSPR